MYQTNWTKESVDSLLIIYNELAIVNDKINHPKFKLVDEKVTLSINVFNSNFDESITSAITTFSAAKVPVFSKRII